MRKLTGWVVVALGALLIALGEAYRSGGGTAPGSDFITANGAVVSLLGLGIAALGRRVHFGGDADWRNRAMGMSLGALLSAVWRGAVELAPGAHPGAIAWTGIVLATFALLGPAMCCWGYVAATFLPRSEPQPMQTGAEADTRRTAA
jgi:hypothetical protein